MVEDDVEEDGDLVSSMINFPIHEQETGTSAPPTIIIDDDDEENEAVEEDDANNAAKSPVIINIIE